MRLSDAVMRRHKTKAVYANHPASPWLNEDAVADATPRSLEPIVRSSPRLLWPLAPINGLTLPIADCSKREDYCHGAQQGSNWVITRIQDRKNSKIADEPGCVNHPSLPREG
jgi:hypothetical protein